MRKLKNKEKKVKVEKGIKHMEVFRQPSPQELEECEFSMNMGNLAKVVEKHKDIWYRDEGCLNQYYKIVLGRVINLSKEIFLNYFGDREVSKDPWTTKVLSKTMGYCTSAFYKEASLPDVREKLPAGFMGTLSAWAKIIRGLDNNKMRNVAKRYGLEEKFNKIIDLSDKFMLMIFEEIIQDVTALEKGIIFTK